MNRQTDQSLEAPSWSLKMAVRSFFKKIFLRSIFLFLMHGIQLISVFFTNMHCSSNTLCTSPLHCWASTGRVSTFSSLDTQYLIMQIYTCITRNSVPHNPELPLPSPFDFILSHSPLDKWHRIHLPLLMLSTSFSITIGLPPLLLTT